MAYNRPIPSHLRHTSLSAPTSSINSNSSSSHSPVLLARIAEKKTELAHLRELRDLSGQLAGQMSALEEKLSTLNDGTEAVAAVLSNWHNVLRAINMASMKLPKPEEESEDQDQEQGIALPQTLVRIPVQRE